MLQPDSDIYIIHKPANSDWVVSNRYAGGKSTPLDDATKNEMVWNIIGSDINNMKTVTFSRNRTNSYNSGDFQFSNNNNFHVLFAKGTLGTNSNPNYHNSNRHVSSERFSLTDCGKCYT